MQDSKKERNRACASKASLGKAEIGALRMNRTAVNVLIGLSATDGDVPATCVPISGGAPAYGYMTREQADHFGEANEMMWFAEWNGVSFDLIEPMTADEIDAVRTNDNEVPF